MELILNDLLFALSAALDCVEGELIGVTTNHSKRVAYLSVRMGKTLGITTQEQFYLAAAAVLHDNALTEYIQEEQRKGRLPNQGSAEKNAFGRHCVMGENNVKSLSVYPHIQGAILYHHECADGSGPFEKTAEETPLFARLIHFADTLDAVYDLENVTEEKYSKILSFINKKKGVLFDDECVRAFQRSCPYEQMQTMSATYLDDRLLKELPKIKHHYHTQELTDLSSMFARITDYKSHFTCTHSIGVARKARRMAEYYGWDEETQVKMYFAGALHDVGKLMIGNEILEKPGRLTAEEYKNIQNHAMGTYVILSRIDGLEDITSWAALHHEKLDGSGYPFGKTAAELGKKERVMMCLDIYQALRESRPYKEGMTHEKTMAIIGKMVDKGQLDAEIAEDVNRCFGTASQDRDFI